ncbi:hypothetical protein CHEID_06240 [Corynebacterium heidelbergense]|uniref:hypothetical protein n=1 Tax=Corynebacterium heidelbergense TaxID=2055947 RepID=UPI00235A364D|nr:hypothetical protein [Corynebacterium heidelbergense]WCZ36785.1 hypothetical protein CHEID_06240 [Corynebacterium heidelbergense]
MTASPIADLADTLLTWASSTEADLAARFAELDLFVDLDTGGDDLERMTRFYGTFLRRQLAAGADLAGLLAACPALTAATLLTRAARLNEVRELPREYWAGLELEPTADRLALIEGRYRDLLSAAGLDPVDSASTGPDGELGRLFAHVGLATDWIPEIIELIDERLNAGNEQPAAEEAAAIVAALAKQDIQAGPLCATQPERAARLIEPIVRIVHHAHEHPHSWQYTLPSPQELGLPALVREDVIEELRERPAGLVDRRHRVGVAHRENQPRIRLDAPRNRVVLRLPAQHLENTPGAEVRWRLDFDGHPAAFRTGRADRPGQDLQPEQQLSEIVDIPIRRPLREISVRNTTDGQHWSLPLVDTEDPVLIFSARGMDLTDRACLHHSSVWVVCPADARAVDLVRDRDITVEQEHNVKAWEGWVIRLLDLTEALSLHVGQPGQRQPAMAGVRAVDPRQRVRFSDGGEAVWAVQTATGKQVYSDGLQVEFPPTISGATETWYLSVSAYAGPGEVGEDVSEEEPLEVPAEGGVFEVFDPDAYDSPWVGEYLVRLRGPRNESFRHEHAIIEGLRVAADSQGPAASTRLPLSGGLSAVTVRLLPGDKPFETLPPIAIGPQERYGTAVVETDAGDALPIVILPPRLRYQLPLIGEDPMWRTEAITTAAAWINTAAKFRVRPGSGVHSSHSEDPAIDNPRIVIRNRHGSPQRTMPLHTVDNITWVAELGAGAASLASLAEGSVELEFTDVGTGKRISVRIANIRAQEQWSAVYEQTADAQAQLRFDQAPDWSQAWVWPLTAPWEPARTVHVGGDHVAHLPAELVGAGPLAVQLHAPDRFSDLRAPVGPGQRSVTVSAPGSFGLGDATNFAQLSAFLAADEHDLPEIPTAPEVLPTLWDVQAGWLQGRTDITQPVLNKIRTALTRHPRESVHAMAQSLVPAQDRPAQFIASGLVHSSFAAPEGPGERTGAVWISALEIMGEWACLNEDAEPDRSRAKALLQQLAEIAGSNLATTVHTGRDTSLETACIDHTTVQIAHMDPAQQAAVLDMFFGGAGVVPGALSDDNSRLIAVFDTFTHRQELSDLLADPQLMTTAVSVLRRIKSTNRQLYVSARVRLDRLEGVDTEDARNRWALAPVISMIFALATRMHAHGHLQNLGKLPQAYPGWAEMARLVPDLVTGDLAAADAMVLGVFGPEA